MKTILALILCISSLNTFANTDLAGKISRIWLADSGDLWLKMDHDAFDDRCKPGWWGFNVVIPKSSPSFPYHYGLVVAAQAQNKRLFFANFGVFDGSGPCDITKTGYGIVMLPN